MSTARHLINGQQAEQYACEHLKKHGLSLVTRNYRCRYGELDLIMRSKSCLIVAEVRYRQSARFGGGAATVTAAKQRRIIKSARCYLQQHSEHRDLPVRFDVIALSGELPKPVVEWLPNAFSTDGII